MVTEEEVIWCYRTILGREPESQQAVRGHLKQPDFAALREVFLQSPEFARKQGSAAKQRAFYPLDHPGIEVDYKATSSQLAECIAKIKAAWSHLGITRPHHSVLTDQKFLPSNLEENLDTFFASGETEAAGIEKILARNGLASLESKCCVEYGCGVGRVTMGLAQRFGEIHAYDISPPHLSLAEQRAQEVGVTNCKFHLCSDEPLAALEVCDVFYSRIVFQHNPPPCHTSSHQECATVTQERRNCNFSSADLQTGISLLS